MRLNAFFWSSVMNSITNALHATALFIYTYLVYAGLSRGAEHYTIWILLTFLTITVLKMLGIIVHIPAVEHNRRWHDIIWVVIAVGVTMLNAVTLQALRMPPSLLWTGTGITAVLAGVFIWSLFQPGNGNFAYVAVAMVIVYTLCSVLTEGMVRLAWICLLLSNLAWPLLKLNRYLHEHKYHNDIYHILLIGSSYILFKSIETGGWFAAF